MALTQKQKDRRKLLYEIEEEVKTALDAPADTSIANNAAKRVFELAIDLVKFIDIEGEKE